MEKDRFHRILEDIDRINAEDPHLEKKGDTEVPKELLYGQRMSTMLLEFEPQASEVLRIAVRAQHIKRWSVPRESYPMDRKGYLLWRTDLKKFHGQLTGELMAKNRYPEEDIKRVDDLINKRRLKTDPEAQCLEDVVCLVFLKYYFDDFIAKHKDEEEKIVEIVRKTWSKMSKKGHEAAMLMEHSGKALKLIGKALVD
ncbi:DUF4202 domain-containing protein [Lunatibacter salilacus]|uniref:DUF4202 domain-containing protein n=1 Tax=Lunatibacter salilacus TaxID=2483804 RepID=UPI00131BE842|nr:DUF4202 domain-containing protein [Lunatibacter salilacus]